MAVSIPSPRYSLHRLRSDFAFNSPRCPRADEPRNPRAETEKSRQRKISTPCRASPWLSPPTLAAPDPGIIIDGR
ncbi:hypothetical protein LY76DRAFT_586630 [Colletotrichum caudatum]|nr:hypothetical protein LY76DRAFT_586630 [Colletotrichum caudatum]